MKTLLFIIIGLSLVNCKKYNCECVTETLSHFPTSTTSNKQISAISKSSATKKCDEYNQQGSYGGEMTTCQIK
jgi:hypothetical protein